MSTNTPNDDQLALEPGATGITPFDCPNEEALSAHYAAEFAAQFGGAQGEFYVLMDQVERQPPGPGPEHDPLYGEPTVPVRPEQDIRTDQTWRFRDPLLVTFTISAYEESREPGPPGSTKASTMSVSIPSTNFNKIGTCTPTMENIAGAGELGPTTPKPGDVIYVAAQFQQFFDVDSVNPNGFLRPGSAPSYYDLSLVRRSKYFPERKTILPNVTSFPVKSDEGTGVQ